MQTFKKARWTHEGFRPLAGAELTALHATIEEAFGACMIVDGSDDYGAPMQASPNKLCREFALLPVAKYQSGVSGTNNSGLVFTPDEFATLKRLYAARFGTEIEHALQVTKIGEGAL